MSHEITTAFVQQFQASLELLTQQTSSALRGAVREETLVGEKGFFDQIGATELVEVTSRNMDTPIVDSIHARRRVVSTPFVWADLLDGADSPRILADPTSKYLEAAKAACNRKIDYIICMAAVGTAYTGATGSTTTILPAAQKVAVNYGGSNCNLSIPKLVRARGILWGNDVDESEEIHIAVRGSQLEAMLMQARATSSDYVGPLQALLNGEINRFLGITWHRTQQVYNSSSIAYCPMWAKSGILLAKSAEIRTKITERADKNYAIQAWAKMDMGATRMQETKVVEIACDETVALALA